mmetsp:Transcript_89517/g.252181  ORF Transcript_89517/g.252181 Transcript_89517/m.252181 type:complete len:731 (-) Transcript_89517:88-2280(-)
MAGNWSWRCPGFVRWSCFTFAGLIAVAQAGVQPERVDEFVSRRQPILSHNNVGAIDASTRPADDQAPQPSAADLATVMAALRQRPVMKHLGPTREPAGPDAHGGNFVAYPPSRLRAPATLDEPSAVLPGAMASLQASEKHHDFWGHGSVVAGLELQSHAETSGAASLSVAVLPARGRNTTSLGTRGLPVVSGIGDPTQSRRRRRSTVGTLRYPVGCLDGPIWRGSVPQPPHQSATLPATFFQVDAEVSHPNASGTGNGGNATKHGDGVYGPPVAGGNDAAILGTAQRADDANVAPQAPQAPTVSFGGDSAFTPGSVQKAEASPVATQEPQKPQEPQGPQGPQALQEPQKSQEPQGSQALQEPSEPWQPQGKPASTLRNATQLALPLADQRVSGAKAASKNQTQGKAYDTTKWVVLAIVGVAAAVNIFTSLIRHCSVNKDLSLHLAMEQIQFARPVDLRSMFGLPGHVGRPVPPLSPGLLMRIQGRVATTPGTALVAPFSGRPCVFYSASVTRLGRQDGVHQPPLAFHTASVDFTIEVTDAPDLKIVVHGQDVSLFGMCEGQKSWERTLEDSPDGWRGFLLAHLLARGGSEPSAHITHCVDLGSDGVILEFRECALLVGSEVTCAGEVARDRNGGLGLYPWRPAFGGEPLPDRQRSLNLLGHAADAGPRAQGGVDGAAVWRRCGLLGQVNISDDPSFFDGQAWTPQPLWTEHKSGSFMSAWWKEWMTWLPC